jgi:hypothetical protein
LELEKEKEYETKLSYLINYRRVLENSGILNLTRKLNTDNTDAYEAIKQRTKADTKN